MLHKNRTPYASERLAGFGFLYLLGVFWGDIGFVELPFVWAVLIAGPWAIPGFPNLKREAHSYARLSAPPCDWLQRKPKCLEFLLSSSVLLVGGKFSFSPFLPLLGFCCLSL